MKKKFLFLMMSLLPLDLWAYSVFSFKPLDWNIIKTVDVMVIGYGEEMGMLFFNSAVTRGRYQQEISGPSRAQIFIWAKENGKSEDRDEITRRGFNLIDVDNRKLSISKIEDIIFGLKANVQSLQIFSHNAALEGSAFQQRRKKIDADSMNWSKLRSKFTNTSYVILHGCNTGFKIAPEISAILKRPVFGSLTSTDFQHIFNDNEWFFNNEGEHPSSAVKAKTNNYLYAQSKACWKGFCQRMMPNNNPYRGHWGEYKVGLPYYKAFCRYNGDESSCLAGIKEGVLAWTNLNGQTRQDKVIDFICSRDSTGTRFNDCKNYLLNGVEKKFFNGNTLHCTLKGCLYKLKRKNFIGTDAGIEVFKKEYDFLMNVLK